MNEDEIARSIIETVEKITGRKGIRPTDRLVKDLGMESIDLVELLTDLEHIALVQLNDKVMLSKTVGDLITWFQFAVQHPEKLTIERAKIEQEIKENQGRYKSQYEASLKFRRVRWIIFLVVALWYIFYFLFRK